MRTNVYIDGFNLYYGALRGTAYKWLNPWVMCQALLPQHQIVELKYFTANVSSRPGDPGAPTRQQAYLRALATLPNTQIVYGHFLTNEIWMPEAGCPAGQQRHVKVIKTEEKGSDVNLAAHLLRDAYTSSADAYVLVTNDSDLAEPIRIVRQELNARVGVLNPHRKPAHKLRKVASFLKPIRKGVLGASQFATTLHDANGTITKPANW